MAPARDVFIVRTGLANLASVIAGFRRAGARPAVTEDPGDVARASHVVLPGVGAFGAAMKHLQECGLVEPLRERLHAGRPTFCVCVGHQILCRASEEDPGVEGLAFVDATVRRFPDNVRVPQLGWNRIVPGAGARLLDEGFAYFANSYCVPDEPKGWVAATAEHGIRFVAGMEKGRVLGCQFHPELSGAFGAAVLERWLAVEDD